MNTTFVDLLDEQQGFLEESYEQVNEALRLLYKLADENEADEKKIKTLKKLQEEHPALVKSMANLKSNQSSVMESYNTKVKISPSADTARSKLFFSYKDASNPDNLFIYTRELRNLNRSWMIHVNLLGRLSMKLCRQLESTGDTSKIVINRTNPPQEIDEILKQYDSLRSEGENDEQIIDDANELRYNLLQYIDNIKFSRARYSLENKYLLKDLFEKLTKDVANWRQQWDSLENMLFGESGNSMKKVVQKIESLKKDLDNSPEPADGDVDMM